MSHELHRNLKIYRQSWKLEWDHVSVRLIDLDYREYGCLVVVLLYESFQRKSGWRFAAGLTYWIGCNPIFDPSADMCNKWHRKLRITLRFIIYFGIDFIQKEYFLVKFHVVEVLYRMRNRIQESIWRKGLTNFTEISRFTENPRNRNGITFMFIRSI